MATIGLDKIYYAPITEDSSGNETYGTPVQLSKGISAEISVEMREGELFGDDGVAESVKEFLKGKLSMNLVDLIPTAAAAILGARVDNNGALVSSAEDVAPYVAVGFRARKSNGKYRYFWLYRVKFGIPNTSLQTKGSGINFSTPTVEGEFTRRNKLSGDDHPWKTEITEGDSGVSASTLSGWFSSVYEPSFTAGGGNGGNS